MLQIVVARAERRHRCGVDLAIRERLKHVVLEAVGDRVRAMLIEVHIRE
jgi:hypothetical protein